MDCNLHKLGDGVPITMVNHSPREIVELHLQLFISDFFFIAAAVLAGGLYQTSAFGFRENGDRVGGRRRFNGSQWNPKGELLNMNHL